MFHFLCFLICLCSPFTLGSISCHSISHLVPLLYLAHISTPNYIGNLMVGPSVNELSKPGILGN